MPIVRSVAQSFAILRHLARGAPLALSAIARDLGLNPSTTFNLLKTLEAEGAIERDPGSKAYRLAPDWSALAPLGEPRAQALVAAARPLLARFAQRVDAAAAMWKAIARDRLQLVVRAESGAGMRVGIADGQRQPLGGGAAGRALAAAQRVDRAELARRYEAVQWQKPLAFDDYARQVAQASEAGFAIDDGFAHRGICTVAVAIAGIAPGFCLSASIFAGARSDEEVAALACALGEVRDALLRAVSD